MARKTNKETEKKEVKGTNLCKFEGHICNYWSGKSDKAPDMISLEIPYGEYGTRVPIKIWKDSNAMKDVEKKEIDEGMDVICYAEVVCLKNNDYVPQFFATGFDLVES